MRRWHILLKCRHVAALLPYCGYVQAKASRADLLTQAQVPAIRATLPIQAQVQALRATLPPQAQVQAFRATLPTQAQVQAIRATLLRGGPATQQLTLARPAWALLWWADLPHQQLRPSQAWW